MGLFAEAVRDFVKGHPGLFVTDLVFLLSVPLRQVVLPHLTGRVVDAAQTDMAAFGRRMAAVIVCVALATAGDDLHDWHSAHMRPKMDAFVRARIVEHVMRLHRGRYQDLGTGDVVSRIVRIPAIVMRWFNDTKDFLLPYFVVFVATVAYFGRIDWVLGVAFAGLAFVVVALLVSAPSACSDVTRRRDTVFVAMCEAIEDLLNNLLSVFTSGTEADELARIATQGRALGEEYKATMMCALRLKALAFPVLIGFLVLFAWRTARLLREGRVRAGTFTALFTMALNFHGSVEWLVDVIRDVVFDVGVIANAEEALEGHRPEVVVSDGPPPVGAAGVVDVWYRPPGAERDVLRGLSLTVREGERVAVMGGVGAGKSTLLRVMAGLTTPDRGHAFGEVGYVPQTATLFDRTLLENLTYGSQGAVTRDDVEAALRETGLADDFAPLLDSRVGKNGATLSGGQRQLVWCLRVLLRRPAVLLLDEPTASMDDASRRVLLRMIERWGRTVVMVTHDAALARSATRTVRLVDGVVVHA
jgi:ABC-type multidrug transport system fused ATPase/permease subunit